MKLIGMRNILLLTLVELGELYTSLNKAKKTKARNERTKLNLPLF